MANKKHDGSCHVPLCQVGSSCHVGSCMVHVMFFNLMWVHVMLFEVMYVHIMFVHDMVLHMATLGCIQGDQLPLCPSGTILIWI